MEIRRGNTLITHETWFPSIFLPLIEDTREAKEAFLVQLLHELSNAASGLLTVADVLLMHSLSCQQKPTREGKRNFAQSS